MQCFFAQSYLSCQFLRLRIGLHGAAPVAGDKLFLLTNNADLIVAGAGGAGFEPLRRYTVAQNPTWAHPLLTGKGIMVKDAEMLTLWSIN